MDDDGDDDESSQAWAWCQLSRLLCDDHEAPLDDVLQSVAQLLPHLLFAGSCSHHSCAAAEIWLRQNGVAPERKECTSENCNNHRHRELIASTEIPIGKNHSATSGGMSGRIELYRVGGDGGGGGVSSQQPEPDDSQQQRATRTAVLQSVARMLGSYLEHRRIRNTQTILFEKTNDLHCLLGLNDLKFRHVNPAWTTLLGYTPDEVIGKTPQDFVHPDDRATAHFYVPTSNPQSPSDCSAGSAPSSDHPLARFENRLLCRDGSCRWFEWSTVPDAERHCVLGVARDVTARKAVEDSLRESERRLRESQSIARLGQWELDLTTNTLYWSDEIYRLFRVDKGKFGASYEAFLSAIHPDDRDKVHRAYTASLQTRQPYEIAHRLLFADGTVKHVNEICRTEYDCSDGRPLRSIGTVQDITELTQAYEDLRVAKERAEEAARLKSAFLANMSHEIRTPMNAVIGYTDLMMDGSDLSKEHKEYLQIVKNSGKHLLTLINDILDVSKIEAGQMSIERTAFSLRDTLTTVNFNANVILTLKSCGDRITFKPPAIEDLDGLHSGIQDILVGDQVRIQQVLNNLISNAIKFTDSGSVEYSLKLLVGPESKMMEFRVADTGVGIPIDRQQEIFEAFQQAGPHAGAHDSRELGGTGLGLSIARRLAKMMGGEIRLESKTCGPDHGSIFYFTIPYIPAPTEMNNVQQSSRESSLHSSMSDDTLEGKILIVDDSKINLKLAERLVVKMGCTAVTAANGEIAVSMFQSDPTIRVILMDKQMPICDGLEATREIRKIEQREGRTRMPIVAVTAAAMSEDRTACLLSGCDDYLTKPLDMNELHRVLSIYL